MFVWENTKYLNKMETDTIKKRKLVRSNQKQLAALINYMSNHRKFANGEYTGAVGYKQYMKEWERLKAYLCDLGPYKTVEQWRTTWRDLKKRARVEAGSQNDLTDATTKILDVIGTDVSANRLTTRKFSTSNLTQEASVTESDTEEFTVASTPITKKAKTKDPLLNGVDVLHVVPTQHFTNAGHDEFDLFGQTIAQQLRQLPLEYALETEEMILATVRRQRIKVTTLIKTDHDDESDE